MNLALRVGESLWGHEKDSPGLIPGQKSAGGRGLSTRDARRGTRENLCAGSERCRRLPGEISAHDQSYCPFPKEASLAPSSI